MKWIEVTIYTSEEGLDAVCGRLEMLGVEQVSIVEGKEGIEALLGETKEYWDLADPSELMSGDPCVKAYFPYEEGGMNNANEVKASFEELKNIETGLNLGSLQCIIKIVEEEDWANNWKLYYKPIAVGKKLLVKPTWETIDEANGRTVLEIDPGMAFGTGSHQTTKLCLEYLENVIKNGMSVADLGCGSGILSIASLLLGADKAIAADIDPIAEKIVMENAQLNGIHEDRLTVMTGDVLKEGSVKDKIASEKYDVVVANIVASVIIRLASFVPFIMKDDAVFITSGIILERVDEVKEALKNNGLEVINIRKDGEWVAMMATKSKN